MNKENSHFCWSCGKPLTDCHCEEGPQPINQKKPKQTLPICQLSPDYEELKYLLKSELVMMRLCLPPIYL